MTIFLRKVWHAWKRFGQKVGDFLARVLLSLFYFTFFMPFALIVRLFQDPLKQRPGDVKSYWEGKQAETTSLDDAHRGF